MNSKIFGLTMRAFAVWIVLICTEFLHGIARVILLQQFAGDLRARQIAVFTGILIILAIAYFCIEWIHAASNFQLFFVGCLWFLLTFPFEILLGRLLNLSWDRIFSDYDILQGGLMPIGLLFLTLSPLMAAKLKKCFANKYSVI